MKSCTDCGHIGECFWKHVPPPTISVISPMWDELEHIIERLAMDIAAACPHHGPKEGA